MAFTNSSRSFAGGADATEKNNSTNGSLNAPFGGRINSWGSSIWSGGITSSQVASTAPRDNSVSREQPKSNMSKNIEAKTGSGSLVDSSVCDDYAPRPPWGSNRSSNSTRSIPQTRYGDNSLTQQRGLSNAGMSQTSTNMNMSTAAISYASRAPAANLNSTAPAQARPSFGSTFIGPNGRGSESAPFQVYTKFDRPSDPMLLKQADSPIGSWGNGSIASSPSDERRPQYPIQYNNGRMGSFPTSRDGSDPPSRHSDQRPMNSQMSQRETPTSSRAPSNTSIRNEAYNINLQANGDHIAMQLEQFSFGNESRLGTSHKPSIADDSSISTMARGVLPCYGNEVSRSSSVAEVPCTSRNHSFQDDNSFLQQAIGFSHYSDSNYPERFLQSGGAYEFRPGQPYQSNAIASRSYEMSVASGQSQDWSDYTSGPQSSNRRSPGHSDQQAYVDPRIQQFMAAQFRNPYSNVYNPYAAQTAIQLHAASPYLNMLPVNMSMIGNGDASRAPRQSTAGEGVQSTLMYEFKCNLKTKRYELRDIYDHIAEFCGDQHGSRFIQTKLETANSDEKERVFREIEPNANPLMSDVFGNYVIQKFFEFGDQTHKKILANKMRGHVLQLSLQVYGCRVVQKALNHVLIDQQALLIRELKNHVVKCVKDQNGNHVIQRAIEICPPATIEFIIDAFRGQVQQLSIHSYGCRVIQRCLEKCDLPSKAMIMSELLDGIPTMICDSFGNYVVQHIVVHDDGEGRRRVLRIVGSGLEGYCKHKYASNVVEKCLERADDAWRRNVVLTLARAQQAPRRMDMPRESEGGVLVSMIKDQYGNYVIQKLLDILARDDYFLFLEVLHPAMTQAKRTGCGKQVLSIEKKMHRFEDLMSSVGPAPSTHYRGPHYHMPPMAIGMAPPQQFVSHYTSAATTPPPLTADTQSLQSSRVPSVNGDAIEGASASRKGSEQSNDYY